MESRALRWVVLLAAAVIVFGVTVALATRVVPGPYTEADYLVIGSAATMLTLLIVFLVLITSFFKSPDTFFRRRQKATPPADSDENPKE